MLPSKTIVTGTSADLRRLKMIDVKKILIKHGYNGDHIEKLQRWEKIELLRELSNKLGKDVENDDDVHNYFFSFICFIRKKY